MAETSRHFAEVAIVARGTIGPAYSLQEGLISLCSGMEAPGWPTNIPFASQIWRCFRHSSTRTSVVRHTCSWSKADSTSGLQERLSPSLCFFESTLRPSRSFASLHSCARSSQMSLQCRRVKTRCPNAVEGSQLIEYCVSLPCAFLRRSARGEVTGDSLSNIVFSESNSGGSASRIVSSFPPADKRCTSLVASKIVCLLGSGNRDARKLGPSFALLEHKDSPLLGSGSMTIASNARRRSLRGATQVSCRTPVLPKNVYAPGWMQAGRLKISQAGYRHIVYGSVIISYQSYCILAPAHTHCSSSKALSANCAKWRDV